MHTKQQLVVAGHGMVGHRLIELAVERGLTDTWDITVIGEEPRLAYDRVHLTSWFDGRDADLLCMVGDEARNHPAVTYVTGAQVTAIDRAARVVTCTSAEDDIRTYAYDHLVLATGSSPFVPPTPDLVGHGTFVYRTIEDLEAITAFAAECRVGAVIGGGLLGLEAANALRLLGLETHIVEMAPRLMAVQLDAGGAKVLRRQVEALGLHVHTGFATASASRNGDGTLIGLVDGDGVLVPAEVIVVAAGIRPRDELARAAELEMGARGGVVVDDACCTSDAAVSAIGEVACHKGRVHGLVAPGYTMAGVVVDRLLGREVMFEPGEMATTLKLLGVDVAAVGDPHASGDDIDEIVASDPVAGRYQKAMVRNGTLVGAVMVGDLSSYSLFAAMASGAMACPDDLSSLVMPASADRPAMSLPDAARVCSCHNVDAGAIRDAIRAEDLCDVGGIKACTKAGTGCGSCTTLLKDLLNEEMAAAGKVVRNDLCEHFAFSRRELFDIVRVRNIRSFAELISAHGSGRGCEICKPAVASMLASMASGYILDGEQATLQDTNDHFLANIQKDGTYSVVPRVPGGEILPSQLIALGEVAGEFDLFTKITGGQRVDLLGARVDQLPEIWRRLIDAGFESGHAYGKSLRTVKSCVGSTWCRYGVQDSVGLAVELELRYRGLRSPHKIKFGVSGCARECAEAQGKDVGIIATERGWNLYVGGNGGMTPRHAVLLAEDLGHDELVRIIDRFLMYYVRTADRLERTATWLLKLDGGIESLREVVLHDRLGINDELEAEMARHVDTYECEWKATLDDPIRLARFVSFVNAPDAVDGELLYVRERGQRRPARPGEMADAISRSTPVRLSPARRSNP